ncbi:MAG TPA: DUF1127 domain-containing protein [Sphingomonas sp.]|nr:DUF1127 domain-containing protein [Sphingomonas sp.]
MISIGRSHDAARFADGTSSAGLRHADGFRQALVAAPARVIDWLRMWHQMRRAIRDVAALDDRMLADIGLSRGAVVYAVVRGRFPNREQDW